MKHLKIIISILASIIISGCYPQVDPSLIYVGTVDVSPDTLTEAGRMINENLAKKLKGRLDSSFTNYKIASHPVIYPHYYGGFYLNGSAKPVFVVVGDSAIARKELHSRMNNDNFILKLGEYSKVQLDSILKTIKEKKDDTSLKILLIRKDERQNRIIVSLDKCSPRNIYKFHKYITNSRAVVFEEVTPVVLL